MLKLGMAFTPMLTVHDVEATSAWLCSVLPLSSAHGGPDFEMLADSNGETIMWLHISNEKSSHPHPHPQLENIDMTNPGSGVVVYLCVATQEELRAIHDNALKANAHIYEAPTVNPNARSMEFTFRSPDGYRFAVHTPFGSVQP